MGEDTFCASCFRPIRYFEDRKEWGHVRGGGAWWLGCRRCYTQYAWYPHPDTCPSCGAGNLLDLHVAMPESKATTA